MPFAIAEFEAALDAMRSTDTQLLPAVSQRMPQVPQMFGNIAFLHGCALRNFTSGELRGA